MQFEKRISCDEALLAIVIWSFSLFPHLLSNENACFGVTRVRFGLLVSSFQSHATSLHCEA